MVKKKVVEKKEVKKVRIVRGDYVQVNAERVYIGAEELCRLYGFDAEECVLIENPSGKQGIDYEVLPKLPLFGPRPNGDY